MKKLDLTNIQFDEKPETAVTVLLKLFEKKNINFITNLERNQIRLQTMAKWYELIEKEDKTAIQCLNETFRYFNQLVTSLHGKRVGEIIDGISNMKHIHEETIKEYERDKI